MRVFVCLSAAYLQEQWTVITVLLPIIVGADLDALDTRYPAFWDKAVVNVVGPLLVSPQVERRTSFCTVGLPVKLMVATYQTKLR